MKSKFSLPLTAALVAGLLTLPPLARAAAADSDSGKSTATARDTAVRERFQAAIAELNLTPEQKQKLAPIIRAEMERMADLRKDESLAPREKLQQLKAIHDETDPQVKAILTAEQYAKWEKKRAEARDELQDRMRQKKKR